jgi:hypothetical protein
MLRTETVEGNIFELLKKEINGIKVDCIQNFHVILQSIILMI